MDDQDREARRKEEMRAVLEGGGGEAEGFEQAEELLIEHASHGDMHAARRAAMDAGIADEEAAAVDEERYGEPDHERSSEDEAG